VPVQEKRAEVHEAFDRLRDEVGSIDSAIASLLNKIQPVCSQSISPESKPQETPPKYTCSVASEMETLSNNLASLRKIVNSNYERVQV